MKKFIIFSSLAILFGIAINYIGTGGSFKKLEPKTLIPNTTAKVNTSKRTVYIPGIGYDLSKQEKEGQLLADKTGIPVTIVYRNNYKSALEDWASRFHRLLGMRKKSTVESAEKTLKELEANEQIKTINGVFHSAGGFEGSKAVEELLEKNPNSKLETIVFAGSPLPIEIVQSLGKHHGLTTYNLVNQGDDVPCAAKGGVYPWTTLPYLVGGDYEKCKITTNPTGTKENHHFSSYIGKIIPLINK